MLRLMVCSVIGNFLCVLTVNSNVRFYWLGAILQPTKVMLMTFTAYSYSQ